MIFRRYTTLMLISGLVLLAAVGLKISPYLISVAPLKGVPQPNSASFPLKSEDRVLIDLNGEWSATNSLSSATLKGGSVVDKIYGVTSQVYSLTNPSGLEVNVPGCWKNQVVSKQFFLSNEYSGRSFRLEILSAPGPVQVYINGTSPTELAGVAAGGYLPSSIEIATPRLKFGEVNTIVLKPEEPQGYSSWYSFPGIDGEVYLEALNSLALGTPGVQTKLSGTDAAVTVQVPVSTQLAQGEVLNGQVSVVDSLGDPVVANTVPVTLGEGGTAVLNAKLTIPQAHLWSLQDPYLYRLDISVSSARGDRDSLSIPLGVREISVQGNKLVLNGQEVLPKIIQRVNDTAQAGAAANAPVVESDLKLVKQQGYNILYIPDHTPEPYLYDVADQNGLLVLSQLPVTGLPSRESGEQAAKAERVLGYHPSFLALGLGNNLDIQSPKVKSYIDNASHNSGVFYSVLSKPNHLVFPAGGFLELNAPFLADFLRSMPNLSATGASINNSTLYNRDRQAKVTTTAAQAPPVIPSTVPFILGGIAICLLLLSAKVGNLRFTHLEGKLKRKIRGQIKLQFYWLLLRLAIICMLLVQGVLSLSNLGYIDYLLQFIGMHWLQTAISVVSRSPWLLFCLLLGLGLLFSLLLNWPRAKTLPAQPPLAVLLWLEKRKRWVLLALAAWVASFYGGPLWLAWLLLGLGFLISSLSCAREIRRVGGKSFSLYYLTFFTLLALGFSALNWDLLILVYHWMLIARG